MYLDKLLVLSCIHIITDLLSCILGEFTMLELAETVKEVSLLFPFP